MTTKLDRLINVVALLLSAIWALGYVLSLVYLIFGAETLWAASYLVMALLPFIDPGKVYTSEIKPLTTTKV